MISNTIWLVLFSNLMFRFGHSCMSRSKLGSFKVPEDQLQWKEPIPSASINTRFAYVDDENSLEKMLAELKNAEELAVDSEFHSIRSYQGVTCVLQISSRTKDYVIDAIALKKKLKALNKLFTNPKVVKVLHDASNDVVWMEKDLNLYLVNMFDTFLAAKALNTSRRGYAYLLQHYCNVDIEKKRKYQAYYDWRFRPITREAMAYARKDTHYLLWLFDIMRNELIAKANGSTELLRDVYKQGITLCKESVLAVEFRLGRAGIANLSEKKRIPDEWFGWSQKFKETTAEDCYQNTIRKREKLKKRPLDSRQLYALRSLCQWRDTIARDLDESVGYVMPYRILVQLVEKLPDKIRDIIEYCKPGPVPSLVQRNLGHVVQLIRKARRQPVDGDYFPISTTNRYRSTHRFRSNTTKKRFPRKKFDKMNSAQTATDNG